MARQVLGSAAITSLSQVIAQLPDEALHLVAIGLKRRISGIDVRFEREHHHPQQSVLKPQAGQRQTACMRYIGAPHRSQSIASA